MFHFAGAETRRGAVAEGYQFAPHERPTFAGSPYVPSHPPLRRLGYAAIGTLAAVGSSLGNSLINVNVANLAGSLGLYAFEASLLPAIYVAFNASANLMLVKGRAQLGIPAITHGLLIVYAAVAALQLVLPGMLTAMLVRAVSGMTAAALITFSIYNWMQVLPPKARPVALVLGICLSQLGLPLARLFPVEMLAGLDWRAVHLTEFAVAATLLAASTALPLPPSDRAKAFEAEDFLTYGLVLTGFLALCIVLAEGRLLWWTDTPWLGVSLVLAVVLLSAALMLEMRRSNPLLKLDWLGSVAILRFAAVALLVRLALAEQTYGAVGFLTSGGLTNDQLHTLFVFVAIAMLLGTVTAVLTLSETRLTWQVMFAALVIAAAAFIDAGSTSLTRPPELYLSQSLVAFGTTLFIGPALLFGVMRMLQRGPDHLVSFVVLFSTTQNLGGLVGSALLGSYQAMASRFHAQTLSEHLLGSDPQVAARLQAGAGSLASTVGDPALRNAQGGGLLSQALTREANTLAYNDIFLFVGVLALLTALYVGYIILLTAIRQSRKVSA